MGRNLRRDLFGNRKYATIAGIGKGILQRGGERLPSFSYFILNRFGRTLYKFLQLRSDSFEGMKGYFPCKQKFLLQILDIEINLALRKTM